MQTKSFTQDRKSKEIDLREFFATEKLVPTQKIVQEDSLFIIFIRDDGFHFYEWFNRSSTFLTIRKFISAFLGLSLSDFTIKMDDKFVEDNDNLPVANDTLTIYVFRSQILQTI